MRSSKYDIKFSTVVDISPFFMLQSSFLLSITTINTQRPFYFSKHVLLLVLLPFFILFLTGLKSILLLIFFCTVVSYLLNYPIILYKYISSHSFISIFLIYRISQQLYLYSWCARADVWFHYLLILMLSIYFTSAPINIHFLY